VKPRSHSGGFPSYIFWFLIRLFAGRTGATLPHTTVGSFMNVDLEPRSAAQRRDRTNPDSILRLARSASTGAALGGNCRGAHVVLELIRAAMV